MPTYVYRCKICDHKEERNFSVLEVPDVIEICPDCGYVPMRKVILPAAISFKGGGFYRTDNSKTTHIKSQLKVGNESSTS